LDKVVILNRFQAEFLLDQTLKRGLGLFNLGQAQALLPKLQSERGAELGQNPVTDHDVMTLNEPAFNGGGMGVVSQQRHDGAGVEIDAQ